MLKSPSSAGVVPLSQKQQKQKGSHRNQRQSQSLPPLLPYTSGGTGGSRSNSNHNTNCRNCSTTSGASHHSGTSEQRGASHYVPKVSKRHFSGRQHGQGHEMNSSQVHQLGTSTSSDSVSHQAHPLSSSHHHHHSHHQHHGSLKTEESQWQSKELSHQIEPFRKITLASRSNIGVTSHNHVCQPPCRGGEVSDGVGGSKSIGHSVSADRFANPQRLPARATRVLHPARLTPLVGARPPQLHHNVPSLHNPGGTNTASPATLTRSRGCSIMTAQLPAMVLFVPQQQQQQSVAIPTTTASIASISSMSSGNEELRSSSHCSGLHLGPLRPPQRPSKPLGKASYMMRDAKPQQRQQEEPTAPVTLKDSLEVSSPALSCYAGIRTSAPVTPTSNSGTGNRSSTFLPTPTQSAGSLVVCEVMNSPDVAASPLTSVPAVPTTIAPLAALFTLASHQVHVEEAAECHVFMDNETITVPCVHTTAALEATADADGRAAEATAPPSITSPLSVTIAIEKHDACRHTEAEEGREGLASSKTVAEDTMEASIEAAETIDDAQYVEQHDLASVFSEMLRDIQQQRPEEGDARVWMLRWFEQRYAETLISGNLLSAFLPGQDVSSEGTHERYGKGGYDIREDQRDRSHSKGSEDLPSPTLVPCTARVSCCSVMTAEISSSTAAAAAAPSTTATHEMARQLGGGTYVGTIEAVQASALAERQQDEPLSSPPPPPRVFSPVDEPDSGFAGTLTLGTGHFQVGLALLALPLQAAHQDGLNETMRTRSSLDARSRISVRSTTPAQQPQKEQDWFTAGGSWYWGGGSTMTSARATSSGTRGSLSDGNLLAQLDFHLLHLGEEDEEEERRTSHHASCVSSTPTSVRSFSPTSTALDYAAQLHASPLAAGKRSGLRSGLPPRAPPPPSAKLTSSSAIALSTSGVVVTADSVLSPPPHQHQQVILNVSTAQPSAPSGHPPTLHPGAPTPLRSSSSSSSRKRTASVTADCVPMQASPLTAIGCCGPSEGQLNAHLNDCLASV